MAKRGPKVRWTEERLEELAQEMLAYFDENPNALYLEDFCAENRLWPQRISEWELKSAGLAEARKIVDALTASRVANRGMTGGANPTMCIFSLKQKGWKDQQDVALSGSIGISSLAQALTDA